MIRNGCQAGINASAFVWGTTCRPHTVFVSMLMAVLILFMPVDSPAQESATMQEIQVRSASTLTLAEAIELALYANRSLKGAGYGVESQAYTLKAAASEFDWKYAPAVTSVATEESQSAGAGVTAEKKFMLGPVATLNPELIKTESQNVDGDWEAKFGVALTIPLLRGFGTEFNMDSVDSAEYSLRSVQRSRFLTKVNIVMETVAAVYNIIEQRELVNLHQAQTERFQNHAMMARSREKVGLATPIDVYRAEIRLKDSQNSLNRAQEALRTAGDRLNVILAAPLEQAIDVVAPLETRPLALTVEAAVEAAMKNRIELAQIDDEIENARRLTRVAKHNLKPQLDLVGRYNRLAIDDEIARAVRTEEDFWSINLISTTDWSRTAEKAAYKRSLLAVKTAELNRWSRIDDIKREVRGVHDALQKAEDRMQIRDEQIGQARGKLALARTKFRHGMADNFDVIEAETELQEARTNLLAARIDHIVGIYRIRAAMGTLIAHKTNDEWGGTK